MIFIRRCEAQNLTILFVSLSAAIFFLLLQISPDLRAEDDETISKKGLEQFYWYDGHIKRKIWMALDEVAVTHDKTGKQEINEYLDLIKPVEPEAILSPDSNEFQSFLEIPKYTKSSELKDQLDKYKLDQRIETVSPVFYRDKNKTKNRHLLTGEIIVHFKHEWSSDQVKQWIDQKGLRQIESYKFSPNAYRLRISDLTTGLKIANDIYESGEVIYAYPNWLKTRTTRLIPNDALFNDQWHLNNTGQGGGTSGEDINITSVWETYLGSTNEIIAIVDDGLEVGHEDLAPNIVPGLSRDFVRNDNNPTAGSHGTSVAGVAAARGNNTLGVTGSAPQAGLVGHRLIPANTDSNEASALTRNNAIIDIYSNSWGVPDDGVSLGGPGPLTQAALMSGVTSGRNGLGSIFTWAGGNGLQVFDNGNFDGYANSRYTIAIAASDNSGEQTFYSEPCACLFVNAPSSGSSLDITTTDRTGSTGSDPGNYTNTFGGTSSVTPLVSGIIALMLQANPNLNWRDVQHILATTAEKNDPTDGDWTTNGAGHDINHNYGFGRVDAQAAVNAAETWISVGTELTTEMTSSPEIPIPDNDATGVVDSIIVTDDHTVEYVDVTFSATHTYRGDLSVELVSPEGTTSVLADVRADPGNDFDQWRFGTARHLGEDSIGTWQLRVADNVGLDIGTFNSWTIKIYSHEKDSDGDGVPDASDDFPDDPDETVDTDKDGIGNNEDTDDDDDGVLDVDDDFPLDPLENKDTDGDGIGDNADPDADNDGIPDTFEDNYSYLDPLNAADALLDEDGDGYSNVREYRVGTDLDDTDSHPRSAYGLELLL